MTLDFAIKNVKYKDMSFDWRKLKAPSYLKNQAEMEIYMVSFARDEVPLPLDDTPYTHNGKIVVDKYLEFHPHFIGLNDKTELEG